MKFEIISKNYNVSNKFEEIVDKKFAKLYKFFDDDTNARINLKKEKEEYVFEITIFAERILRAEVKNTEDMYSNIDLAMEKIVRQINRYKNKFDSKRVKEFVKSLNDEALIQDEAPSKLVKNKVYNLKPMSVDEAKLQMDFLGHNFFVFLNAENDSVSVVYKRNDGNVGLIDTIK